jgi:hypothetical protein
MRFLSGDDLGNIKSLRYTPPDNTTNEGKTETKTIYEGVMDGKVNGVRVLAVGSADGVTLVRKKPTH